MKQRVSIRPLLAIVTGALLAAAIPALPAVGQQSPPQSPPAPVLRIGANATLQANGAAVVVPVRVVCTPGNNFGFITVRVSQVVGKRIASGGGSVEGIACGDTRRVRVPALAIERPFRAGTAFAVADIDICYPEFGCLRGQDFRETQIVKN